MTYVNSSGNCNNNNAYNANRAAPDRVNEEEQKGLHIVLVTRETIGTRSPTPVGSCPEKSGGDGRIPRDADPISAPDLESVIGYDALWESMEKCRRGVVWKGSVASFCMNAAENISRLSDELHDGSYKPRPVSHFTVTSPKRRDIVGIAFRDRVYQRSLNDNVVYPLMSRSWIYDNYACQKGKGTDFGRARFAAFYRKHYVRHGAYGWVLSTDVKGYYPNMRHDVAEACFREKLPDWCYQMVVDVLRGQYPGDVGYNPGSQIVQIAGVSLLSPTDHFVKERLGAKLYGRYMDDSKIIHHDRGFLEHCRDAIAEQIGAIGYSLNEEKTEIRPITDNVPFLGFDFRLTGTGKVLMTLQEESIKRMRRKIGRLAKLEAAGERPEGTTASSYRAWRAHAEKGDSTRLLMRADEWYSEIRKELVA